MSELTKKLKNIDTLPMHMPGHKRNTKKFPDARGLFDIDITEIEGFDNLHAPQGILKESMEKASRVFKAENSIYLVNGSTCGILAGITAVLSEGGKVICDRICHKSVYNALELTGAVPVFIKPALHPVYGVASGVTANDVEDAISQNPDAKLVIITSPTYEGAICDIEAISRVAHRCNIPVLVDSAHGAHLGFGKFPKSARNLGADIVIESLHKTLPSLTQTAICHVNDQYYHKVLEKLSVFETSSPSYVLLSSMDTCVDLIADGEVFHDWQEALLAFNPRLENLQIMKKDYGFFDLDPSKIAIFAKDAVRLAKRLRDHKIEPEMTSLSYVLCMTGAGDDKESLSALSKALEDIDQEFSPFEKIPVYPTLPKAEMTIKQAKSKKTELVEVCQAKGRISAEYIRAYPPGVPVLVPGEALDQGILELFNTYKKNGIELLGDKGPLKDKILVLGT